MVVPAFYQSLVEPTDDLCRSMGARERVLAETTALHVSGLPRRQADVFWRSLRARHQQIVAGVALEWLRTPDVERFVQAGQVLSVAMCLSSRKLRRRVRAQVEVLRDLSYFEQVRRVAFEALWEPLKRKTLAEMRREASSGEEVGAVRAGEAVRRATAVR